MSQFLSPLDIRLLKNGTARLLSPLIFQYENMEITIHAGYISDLASIPNELYSIIGCPSQFAYEAFVHDPLYESRLFDRKTCDKIFHAALLSGGEFKDSVALPKAKAMYLGVRIGGEAYYGMGNLIQARDFVSIKF